MTIFGKCAYEYDGCKASVWKDGDICAYHSRLCSFTPKMSFTALGLILLTIIGYTLWCIK